jgi:hypothetical protein
MRAEDFPASVRWRSGTADNGGVADEVRFESVVDRQVRLAAERGEFDNLPGAGKPLPNWGGQDDELWWLKDYLRREGLTSEAMLSEQLVRGAVAELNERIAAYSHTPSEPFVSLRPVDEEAAVAHWRAAHVPPPAPVVPSPPARRWRPFGRRSRP